MNWQLGVVTACVLVSLALGLTVMRRTPIESRRTLGRVGLSLVVISSAAYFLVN